MQHKARNWWIKEELLDRNLVVVGVDPKLHFVDKGTLSAKGKEILDEIKEELGVEEFYAGALSRSGQNEILFQYPTEKIMKVGQIVKINVPSKLLKTKKDFVTLKRNADGTVLIIP